MTGKILLEFSTNPTIGNDIMLTQEEDSSPPTNSTIRNSVEDIFLSVSTTESYTTSGTSGTLEDMPSLSVTYTASESFVALMAILGNLLVVYVFCTNRPLRKYRNYYIVGLALADFLVGLLGIPLAILASVGLPRNHLYGCLFSVSILMVLCTISILCLVAVSIDRYWATTNPFAYYRNMTTSTSVGIILSCWLVGTIIGFLPLFGWHNREGWESDSNQCHCYFVKIMDYNYLVFLFFSTIVFPAFLMAGFYGYIYHIVLIQIRQKGTLAPQGRKQSEASRSGSLSSDLRGSTGMMRTMVSEKRREAKAAKKLSIIVLFFMICWMPLYTINCIQAFWPNVNVPLELLNFTIILTHANSALNPILYAYHLKEFRFAMKNALCALLSRLCCGCISVPQPKDPTPAVSRSQTANTPIGLKSTHASKFRRVPPYSTRGITTPNGRVVVSSTSSGESFVRPVLSSDKSFTSLSIPSSDSISFQMQEYQYSGSRLHPHFEETTNISKDSSTQSLTIKETLNEETSAPKDSGTSR